MKAKLTQFLDESFKPYGNFPARRDVQQELLANLEERYDDLKTEGKSDTEAYALTIESFGDVSEIMEHVAHDEKPIKRPEDKSWREVVIEMLKHPIRGNDSRFRANDLQQADLADTQLAGSDFSMSALMESNFDKADLRASKFKASALKGASFVGTDLSGAGFFSSDLTEADLSSANLTEATFAYCAFSGAKFDGTIFDKTEFKKSDLTNAAFDGQTLRDTIFDATSLKGATFKDAILEDVSFHHSDTKKAIFDGATMDKVTYALLKGTKANLENVTVK